MFCIAIMMIMMIMIGLQHDGGSIDILSHYVR